MTIDFKGYFQNKNHRQRKINDLGMLESRRWVNNHLDYIHWNPVKHDRVQRVVDWPHSSFHRFVEQGIYPVNWGHSGDFSIHANE